MSSTSRASTSPDSAAHAGVNGIPGRVEVREHTVEIVSDSGEGAQKCGQSFGAVSAMMGNGIWTVEIIPAEIQPPQRTPGSASGVRIRLGAERVTNWGDAAELVVAFNEQVLLARHRLHALADDAIVIVEDMWEHHDDESIRDAWRKAMDEMSGQSYRFVRVPMQEQCLTLVDDPRRGKNMFVLGLLAGIYGRDVERVRAQIRAQFAHKGEAVVQSNIDLMDLGVRWAEEKLGFRIEVPCAAPTAPMVVMNGNEAIGMGAMAAGLEMCAMYPITPATSVSHYLGEVFDRVGGIVHQAEDEIAAVGVAIGASYAGRVAFTVTSGPGLALKTEFLGLAVMTETPLVVVDVQRGGPSTGLPTKVEQSDLLAAIYGQPGDSPKVVIAPSSIEDCFYCMVTARRIAETFRTVVVVLSDANLATGMQPFARPKLDPEWQALEPTRAPVTDGQRPFDWNDDSGLSARIIPGQKGGMHTITGLAHNEAGQVDYQPETNQRGCEMRSRKLAVLQHTLQPPAIHGPEHGDLLVVGWGSTRGAIEEAVDRARAAGLAVSSTHLDFLSPLQPGLKRIFQRFNRVMTVEINYSDDPARPFITEESRRLSQLCMLLRSATLVDVDCWSRVPGEPLRPVRILAAIRAKLTDGGES